MKDHFRNEFAATIFRNKYALTQSETWPARSRCMVEDVCGPLHGQKLMGDSDRRQLEQFITDMKFIPGGRYVYYAGRQAAFYNNCYLFRGEEDTREEWSRLAGNSTSALMSGGGIGCDYSVFRPEGWTLSRTGGQSSGPIPLMNMINEIGRNVMQGGSRRSAIYASLNWQHDDAELFLRAKNWSDLIKEQKSKDFNFPADLDMTNISLNYDNEFLVEAFAHGASDGFVWDDELSPVGLPDTFVENCRQALSTGEPGFSFNFGAKENETLRNACTEVTSEDDSDVCNLGSINLANIDSIDELREVVRLAAKFLVCGTIRAELPYEKVYRVREKNRRLGLGLMGVHEWLLKRGMKYEVTAELREWLEVYRDESVRSADKHCDRLYLSRPVAYRAIAPTGSIGILAGTTTGIEPLFAVAYKRRYLTDGTRWKYQFYVDEMAHEMIQNYGLKPEEVESAIDLAADPERRIKFQADVQEYVDMGISSTINLPEWGSKLNNEDTVQPFAETLAKYAPRIRGFTCYPDGARGGQPLVAVPYEDAIDKKGIEYVEHDVCEITGHGGTCGS